MVDWLEGGEEEEGGFGVQISRTLLEVALLVMMLCLRYVFWGGGLVD